MIRLGYEVYSALITGGSRRQNFPAVTIAALVLMGAVPFLGAQPDPGWNLTAADIVTDTQSFVADCFGAAAQTDVPNPACPACECQSYDEEQV